MIYQNQYTQCLLIMRKTLLYKPVSKQLIGGTEKEENSGVSINLYSYTDTILGKIINFLIEINILFIWSIFEKT